MKNQNKVYTKRVLPTLLGTTISSATALATSTSHAPGCQTFPQFGCYATGVLCSTVPGGKQVELGKPSNGSLVLADRGNDGSVDEIFYLTRNYAPDSFSYILKNVGQKSESDHRYESKGYGYQDKDKKGKGDHYAPVHEAGHIYVDPNSCNGGGDNSNNGNNGNSL